MRYKFQKNMRILSDLVSYCHQRGGTDFHMDMTREEDATLFLVRSRVPALAPQAVEELLEALNYPRRREIEQNYWGLSGEVHTDAEVTLIGMMLDEARVEYNNDTLTIWAKRLDDEVLPDKKRN